MIARTKLLLIADLAIDRGYPTIFKRLLSASEQVARSDRTNTDALLDDAIQDERSDEPPIELIDGDGDGELVPPESEDEAEDEDVEAFFPMGALGQNQRLQGPNVKDVLSLGPKVFKNQ